MYTQKSRCGDRTATTKNDKRADKVNAKRRQATYIQDRTYVGAMCTEKIHYFSRYVGARAYAKKGNSFLGAGGTPRHNLGDPKKAT
jgi:hypothetical protein